MKRWQRIGLDSNGMLQMAKNMNEIFPFLEKYEPYMEQRACRSGDVRDYESIAILHHLEVEDIPALNGITSARRCTAVALDYFFGSWRNGYEFRGREVEILNATECRRRLEWVDVFRKGVLCASCIHDEYGFEELLKWPDVDLPYDEGAWSYTREENYFYIFLALAIREVKFDQQTLLRQKIESGRSLRARLWLTGLDAILSKDTNKLVVAIENLLAYNLKREFRPDHPFLALMVEGTILYNLGMRSGLQMPELPQNIMDRIVTKESLAGPKELSC